MLRLGTLGVVGTALGLLIACGSSDDGGLFNGGAGSAGSGGVAGSSGGSGGSSATGGNSGGSGGVAASGGVSGDGGAGAGGIAGDGGTGAAGAGGTGAGGAGGTGAGGSGGDGGTGAGGVGGTGGTGAGGSGGTGAGGTGATGGSGGGTGATGGSGGSGGTTGPSCVGHCGSSQPVPGSNPQCFCDDQCQQFNDCCSDFAKACTSTTAGQIKCGGATCSASTSFCCQELSSGGNLTPKCFNNGTQCVGPDIECDGPEDCGGGQVCCGQLANFNGTTLYSSFECRAANDCSVNDNRRIVCGSQPSVCPSGTTCGSSGILPEYNVCKT